MQNWIELTSLHVISDLHLGGSKGFQIFGSTDELVWLINQVRTCQHPGTHGLLINGDFVDFLAEEPSTYFDPEGANDKVKRIFCRFRQVFRALQKLVATPQRLLIINLGNHDLELALPWVRAYLTARLANSNEQAHARLILVTDGTGVRCRVGRASVVCLHGNEVDSWNVGDYEKLRRLGRAYQFGCMTDAWIPNAGTRLVIDVMNSVKRQYPFVDLLKPETQGVLPVLAALNPGLHEKLRELASVAGRRGWDAARMRTGFLDVQALEDSGRPSNVTPAAPAQLSSAEAGKALLHDIEQAWRRDVSPISLVRNPQEQLGLWSATGRLFQGKPKHEVLREALEHLDSDRSFDPAASDATFRDIDAMVGSDIDVVIAGHTHLERSLPRINGQGHYFNTGTWARLIYIQPAIRQNEEAFAQLFQLLSGATMDRLDQARIKVQGSAYDVVLKRNTVVIVQASPTSGQVMASLHHVLPATPHDPIRLQSVDTATWEK